MPAVSPHADETIAAPITAPGQAAVSLVRVSGPHVRTIVSALSPLHEKILTSARKLFLSPIHDLTRKGETSTDPIVPDPPGASPGLTPSLLDRGLIVFFEAPHSYTGEDSVEFHLHGSPFLVGRLLESIIHLGARLARPGEFTERAFLNGRMDLSQAEAVADLIAAETQAQADAAQEQLEGRLSKAISAVGEPLRDLLAEIEAYIDFPEEDLEFLSLNAWKARIEAVLLTIENYLETFKTGRLYREGASVVIVGLPNAGKSSLLNRMIGEERAIVTPLPGTTRDSIEEKISLGGLAVRLCDTAGLADSLLEKRSLDEVEKIGIEHSWRRAKTADLILYLLDATKDVAEQATVFAAVSELRKPVLLVASKIDLLPPQTTDESLSRVLFNTDLLPTTEPPIFLSALTGQGLEKLKETLLQRLVGNQSQAARASVMITTQRHYDALQNAAQALLDALQTIATHSPPELIAIDLRAALGALNDIIGITSTEDILGRIFSRFCIGK